MITLVRAYVFLEAGQSGFGFFWPRESFVLEEEKVQEFAEKQLPGFSQDFWDIVCGKQIIGMVGGPGNPRQWYVAE